MIWRNILFCLVLVFTTSSDPYFGIDFRIAPVPEKGPDDVAELSWRDTDAFDMYLKDFDNRVADHFNVTPFYRPMVRFWFFIYTQFDSGQVVFHDKNNLRIIYRVLDFSSLSRKKLSRNTLYILQRKITEEKSSELKESLKSLATNPNASSPVVKDILAALMRAKVKIPGTRELQKKFFKNLADNLRGQTGQSNFIREGIIRSLPYQKFLTKYFTAKNLPSELLAIPFLESSFNPEAQSKVNALGAWQFMPLIASYFVPKRTNHVDYRSNVGVSSVSAAFLMHENFKILKRWDLAVTAYNSGTKHLLKTKRQLNSKDISLEHVIKHSDSKHFGFASKNFYSEFLALVHTLAYKEEIFKELHEHDRSDVSDDLHFYLAKCTLRLDKTLGNDLLDDIDFHNHHLIDFKRPVSRGLIVNSKGKLPSTKFLKLSFDQIVSHKPIAWDKFLKGQSCSTR
jgi:membrane-bound lytic murein transglycosylase D